MYRAMIVKDAEGLNTVLDDSFVLVHMTGMRQNKKAFIQAVMNGTLNYYSCEDDSVEATVNGDTATVIGKAGLLPLCLAEANMLGVLSRICSW